MLKIKLLKTSLIIILQIALLSISGDDLKKPSVFEFGSSMEDMKIALKSMSDSMTVQMNEPIQLPTAQKSQMQLNVYGFKYAGKKRKAELIFADDQLDIIWILTEAEEEKEFLKEFTAMYGKPTHQMKDVTFFLNHGVAVRNVPHEVLFLSERLKAPYKQWLDSQN